MNAGEFAKWTAQDEQGSFSHVGQIESINEKWINLRTVEGLLSFRSTDGTLSAHAEVVLKKSDKTTKAVVTEEVKAPVVKETTPKEVKVGSKLEGAIVIVKANPTASRQELINMFVEQLSMTPAGASTYVYNAKKAVEAGK